jgi:hypothetical protein
MRAPLTIERLLQDSHVGWSVGRQGGIAEFYWVADEPIERGSLSMASARGALSFQPGIAESRIFAGESLGPHNRDSWSQWVAFCLPAAQSVLNARISITELGPDADALHPEDRRALLFDLGIGGRFFQLCVRTRSPETITELRTAAGRALLDEDRLIHALVAMSPARVFESRLARIEVSQPIAATDGHSPNGPHTHLLPDLIQGDGVDGCVAPAGWIAQAVAYPPHPLRDALGDRKTFNAGQFHAFQAWLEEFGDPGHLLVKRTVANAVRSGASPTALDIDQGRLESVRVALRQLRCLDGESQTLSRWCAAFNA